MEGAGTDGLLYPDNDKGSNLTSISKELKEAAKVALNERNNITANSGRKSNHAKNMINRIKVEPIEDFFKSKTVNEWIEEAKNLQIPEQLYGNLWYEGEIVICYASAGVGKTILGYQIAEQIALIGKIVAYFDLELSAKQIEARYSNDWQNHYKFSENLYRFEFNSNADLPQNQKFTEYLIEQIEQSISLIDAKIVLIDNITVFRDDQERAKDATQMMKQLKQLSKKHNLSLLIFAHTPKRDRSKPLTRNDLSGSSMILNFADSAFAIGESNIDVSYRYIKQTKASRYASLVHDGSNVINYEIEKGPDNFTRFVEKGYGNEETHLKHIDIDKRNNEIINYHLQGMSLREIAQKVDLSHTRVSKIIKKYDDENKLPF